jgi:hypothetical protein
VKLFDWFLPVYPREFRERFGAGMHAAFTEDYARARARGRLTGLLFLTTTSLRALCFGFLERLPRTATIRSFVSVDVRDAVRSLRATPSIERPVWEFFRRCICRWGKRTSLGRGSR